MSLKAKIEAVIYASEEPVTLAQLAGLFRAEVLEVRATRLRAEGSLSPTSQGRDVGHPGQHAAPVEDDSPVETLGVVSPGGDVSELAFVVLEESARDAEADLALVVAETEQADKQKLAQAQRLEDRAVREELRGVLDGLIAEYAAGDRGVEIREIAGGYRVATKPEYHDAVRGFVKSLKPPMKLSLQALETLAVIAYKQPVTAPEVSEIRGVDSGGVLGSLVSRKLITTAGRKQVIGRPILYKTTKEFLLRFGLKDVNELPSIEEFEKMAGELADGDETGLESARPELPFEMSGEDVAEAIDEQAAMLRAPGGADAAASDAGERAE